MHVCVEIMNNSNENYADILIIAVIFSCAYMFSEVQFMTETEMGSEQTYELWFF